MQAPEPASRGDAALRRAILVLALLGAAAAAYLTDVHYAAIKPACSFGGDCAKVQTSSYARLAGIPVALLGLLAYLSVLSLLGVRRHDAHARVLMLAITLVGFCFSAYLTYRELFTIGAVCQWCVLSAAIMTLLMIASSARFLRGDR